ncbi:hypothetical protein D9M71_272330 [compost metagenome]
MFEAGHGLLHGQHLALGTGLFIGADEQPLARAQRAPAIAAQLETFAALLPLRVHQVAEVELALAAVFGAELDVLLTTGVVQAQLVVGRGAQDIALVVVQGDVVGVATVVQGEGDVALVGVAVLEGDGHLGALDQRQVQAIGVPGVGSGEA